MIFQKGESYFATPTIKGGAQKIVTVVARNAGRVSFSASEALSQERVSVFDGREIARLQMADGMYTVSSACPANLDAALHVMAVVRPQGFKRAARRFFCGRNRDAKI